MGTISSGVGLMSGMDIEGTVNALMAIEKRPQKQLENRVAGLVQQRTAYLELNALILAMKSAGSGFSEADFFDKSKAVSSNENVLQATASEGALPGNYAFQVHSLVSSHQLISSGFATPDATRVGPTTLTLEGIAAKVNPETSLDLFNGGQGVQRGKIRITDRSGATAEIDLAAALTVDDVLDAINNQTDVNVTAGVSGGHIVLTDQTGQTTGHLSVTNVGMTRTATDLGILGAVSDDVLTGQDVIYLTDRTSLSLLNDGNGVRREGSLDDFSITLRDGSSFNVSLSSKLKSSTRLEALNGGAGVEMGTFRITNRAGASAEVTLSAEQTISEVQSAINAAGSSIGISSTLVDSHLLINDSSGGDGTLSIEDVSGHAARDLGIAAESDATSLTGADIYGVQTIGDVIRAINFDNENTGDLVASLSSDGKGIVLTDASAGSGDLVVEALDNGTGTFSKAAEDLGILTSSSTGTIESRALLAGLDTVLLRSLNGGSGVETGTIQVTAKDGTVTQIDLTDAATLGEVLEAINATSQTSHITAATNSAGNGIVLSDLSGGGGNLVVEDLSGSAAEDLNLLVDQAVDQVGSGNLQRQYVSEATELNKLNGGQGVARGRFTITDTSGGTATIDLTQGNENVLADVIREINNHPGIEVTASINDKGDGLLLTDSAGGAGRLTVAEEGGTTAADLGILGQADEGETTLDGSFETAIEIDADDTLVDVMNKVNASGSGLSASVLNDGSSVAPYRLVLQSESSGRKGEMVIDAGDGPLSFSTLVEARDAVVFIGEPGTPTSLTLTSSTNTLDGVVPNVKIDLLATSSQPVELTVTRDVDSLVTDMKTFVNTFNKVIDKIEDQTKFNEETFEKGVLFGDSTIQRIRSRLYSMFRATVDTDGAFARFSDIGMTLGNGAKLQFDEDTFRQAFAANPDDVVELFTLEEEGLGAVVSDAMASITESETGLIDRRSNALTDQEELLNQRIEQLQNLLDSKEERLYRDFYQMEQALAQLNGIQSSLSGLSALASQFSSSAASALG